MFSGGLEGPDDSPLMFLYAVPGCGPWCWCLWSSGWSRRWATLRRWSSERWRRWRRTPAIHGWCSWGDHGDQPSQTPARSRSAPAEPGSLSRTPLWSSLLPYLRFLQKDQRKCLLRHSRMYTVAEKRTNKTAVYLYQALEWLQKAANF